VEEKEDLCIKNYHGSEDIRPSHSKDVTSRHAVSKQKGYAGTTIPEQSEAADSMNSIGGVQSDLQEQQPG
jgi:hypothetical protein